MNLTWRALPTSALLILLAGSAAAVDGGEHAWGMSRRLGSNWLGVRVIPTTQQLREALGVGADEGALVMEVTRGTPSHRAGLRAGDVLTHVGRTPVGDARDIALADVPPGGNVPLQFVRGRLELNVVAKRGGGGPRPRAGLKRAPGNQRNAAMHPPAQRGAARTAPCPRADQQLEQRLRRLEQRLRRLEEEGAEPQGALTPPDDAT